MNLKSFIPFLETEELDKLIEAVINGEVSDIDLSLLGSFANEEQALRLIEYGLNQDENDPNIVNISLLAMNLGDDKIMELYEMADTNKRINKELLLSCLSEDKIKDLFYKELEKNKKS